MRKAIIFKGIDNSDEVNLIHNNQIIGTCEKNQVLIKKYCEEKIVENVYGNYVSLDLLGIIEELNNDKWCFLDTEDSKNFIFNYDRNEKINKIKNYEYLPPLNTTLNKNNESKETVIQDYHLVIIKNQPTIENNLPEYSVNKVADCFVNPLLKDLNDIIKELCFGRPAYVQKYLNQALRNINNETAVDCKF